MVRNATPQYLRAHVAIAFRQTMHSPHTTNPAAKLRRQLQRYGARRRQSLDEADQALQAIADLLPDALEAGITKGEIERLTGVSRPTIDALLRT